MNWSFYGEKSLNACQNQWFFRNIFANALSTKVPLRREAFLLSKLQTIYSWRGSLVDQVISDYIIPRLNTEWIINESEILDVARDLFDKQFKFASDEGFREPGMGVTKTGDKFAALFEIEYKIKISDETLQKAWSDVETALKNFIEMPLLLNKLRSSRRLIAQRTLDFPVLSAKARSKPDLLAFYRIEPPSIFDWKVHKFGVNDYRQQLATYALALERCKKYKDINDYRGKWLATDYKLYEVQLLTKTIREYQLTENDIDNLEDQIVRSYSQMKLISSGQEKNKYNFERLKTARYSETCETCPFQKICKEVICEKELKQPTFLY